MADDKEIKVLTVRQEYQRNYRLNHKAELKSYRDGYYRRNRERIIAQTTEWALAHPEEVRMIKQRSAAKAAECGPRKPGKPKDPAKVTASNKKHYDKNREAMRARAVIYRAENPEKIRAANKLRYATSEAAAAMDKSTKAWAQENPEQYAGIKHLASIRHRLKKYGLTPERYSEMLVSQDHCCAICRSPTVGNKRAGKGAKPTLTQAVRWPSTARPGDLTWHVDHDHKTGAVRGLLCHFCNVGLGIFRDNPELLVSAANYLMKSKEIGE